MGNVNLITNPSFETNLTGWTFVNATGTRDTTQYMVPPGVASCKVTATAAGVAGMSYALTGLVVGQSYTVSFFVKTQPVGATLFSVVPSVNGQFTPQKPLPALDLWQRRFVGFQAVATTATFTIQTDTAVAINDAFYVDRVQVTSDGLAPYFDGDYPYSTWSGTAHGSTSSNTAFGTAVLGNPTTDTIVVVNGMCLNSLAWNITTKNGRMTLSSTRGDDLTIPGVNGKTFVPNKPIDSGTYSLSMYILGAYADGSIPAAPAMRSLLRENFERILRQCYNLSTPVTIYAWHSGGSVRTTQATLAGSSAPDANVMMGGRRAEVTLLFDVLPGVWSDYAPTTVTGVAGTAWSNQSLSLINLANGTAPIDDSVVTVNGPVTNPTLSNPVTGTSVTYSGTVPTGQSWVVDCGAWTSKVNNVSVLANTTHTGHPRFLLIDPGSISTNPSITMTGSATGVTTNVSVTAKRKHLVG